MLQTYNSFVVLDLGVALLARRGRNHGCGGGGGSEENMRASVSYRFQSDL